eukprot:4437204-Ditylum_brightwellii.AAC.1
MEITYIEDKTGEDDRDEKKKGSKDKEMGKQHEGEDGKNKKNDRSYIDAIKERLIPVASRITAGNYTRDLQIRLQ